MRWLAHIDPSVQKISGWITFIAGVGAFLSWVASHIAALSPYGWGAFAFVGLAAACVLSLVISLGLIAWRFFRPLSPAAVPIDTSNSALWKAEIQSMGSALEKYVDETSAALSEKIERSAVQTAVLSRLTNLERKFSYLIDAINARDAEMQIKQADAMVDPLGRKLLAATSYSDPQAWLADYRSWHDSVAALDRTILNQKVEGFTPYLDIRARDLQKCSETPPTEGLRADDRIIVAYKTVFLAQKRYTIEREQVFRFFSAKGALPG